MAIPNIAYNATSKNSILTLVPPEIYGKKFDITAPIIMTGAGRNKWFNVTQPNDATKTEIGSDGGIIVSSMPQGALVKGGIVFNPTSPTLVQIASLTSYQYTAGIPLCCTLNITNESTGTSITYPFFMFTNNYIGSQFADQMEDFEFKFDCVVPKYLNLSSLTNLLASI